MTLSALFRDAFAVAAVLVRHPSLWWTALVQARRLTPRGWWRRRPFLPVPDADYVRFRLVTMYGDENRRLDPGDLVLYLRWCRAFPRGDADQRPITPAPLAADK